jgi:hypothetical protein
VVRVVGQAAAALEIGARRALPSLCESPDSGRGEVRPMSQEQAVKRWTADTYSLRFEEIDQVTFDVQLATTSSTGDETLQLEIDVLMADGHQHLFVRPACEFGKVVGEILDLVDCPR